MLCAQTELLWIVQLTRSRPVANDKSEASDVRPPPSLKGLFSAVCPWRYRGVGTYPAVPAAAGPIIGQTYTDSQENH